MFEIKSIQKQLELNVFIINSNIQKIHYSLLELKQVSDLLFELTPKDPELIKKWIDEINFSVDEKNFYQNTELVKHFLKGEKISSDTITYHWSASQLDNSELSYRFYAQRNIGKTLKAVYNRINVAWIYFQDISHNAALGYPYAPMSLHFKHNFNWRLYFAYQTVKASVNPERGIKWSTPNIDYGGKGLITIASIPLFDDNKLHGVWSIDVPCSSLYNKFDFETTFSDHVNFITDFEGNVIAHPSIEFLIKEEKGAYLQLKIEELGYRNINLNELVQNQKGTFEIVDNEENELVVVYQVSNEIDWIVFSSFSKDSMIKSVTQKVSESFNKISNQHLPTSSNRLDVNDKMQILIDGYNKMMEVVKEHQQEKTLIENHNMEKLVEEIESLSKKNVKLNELYKNEIKSAKDHLDSKDREITVLTLAAIEKNKLLVTVKSQINQLADTLPKELSKELAFIRKSLRQHLDEDIWERFFFQFERVHPHFFERLKTEYPKLTPNDLKLSAYLKVGMGNKEAAQMSGINPNSLKKNINRLKKKIGLGAEEDLREFLIRFV